MIKYTPELIQPQLPLDETPYGYCRCGCGQEVDISPKNVTRLGWIKGQPKKYIHGHARKPLRTAAEEEKIFWSRFSILKPDECWEWQRGRDKQGYGSFRYQGFLYKTHRLSYMLHYGELPIGFLVCHECDNPPCGNPYHLFLGTQLDNMKDCALKGRANPRFPDDLIRQARQRYEHGERIIDLAEEYHMRSDYLSAIINKRERRHVE